MEATQPQKAEASLPGLIRKVLGSPHAEQVIKSQIIMMASKNLHVPEVATALLEVLPLTKDKETKDQLINFLSNLDTARFSNLDAFYTSLIEVFRHESDRAVRTTLLKRLKQGLHQDARLLSFFIELMGEQLLSEPERQVSADALASVPSISEDMAILVLQRCAYGSDYLQGQALVLAERCPVWSNKIAEVLTGYLDVKNNQDIRMRILNKLAEAKKLTPSYGIILIQLLRTDTDTKIRYQVLECMSYIKPWSADIVAQLLWSARNDGDEGIRTQAALMQKQIPELSNEQLIALAEIMGTDRSEGVRVSILQLLEPVMRLKEIREAVATAFRSNASFFDNEEFNMLIAMLAPYTGREPIIGESLLKSIENLPNLIQRQNVLQLVIPKVKIENVLSTVVRLFQIERDGTLRAVLFNQIRGLSIIRNPELVNIFCEELIEPGSPFRQTCAGVLGVSAELYEQIPPALEDVLMHDQDRELVRVCLEGYLRPQVPKRFEILLEVVRNEVIDTTSRQQCLNEILKLTLNPGQQEELAQTLSNLKPNTLKV